MQKTIADLRPVVLDESVLLSYTGIYDPYDISYESERLFFNREGAGKFGMIPINENTFMLKEIDYLKIQIVKDNDNVVAAKGIWSSGKTQLYKKTR